MDQRDPLEEYGNIRKDLEEEILQGKSPKPDRRHAQIRLGFTEKYKYIPLERMIKENAKGPNWGTQLISAVESLYGLGEELLQLSAKGEEQQHVVLSIDKELKDISGTADILRSLGYRCIDDTSAIVPAGADVNKEITSAVLAELLLAKDEMKTFLSGKHVLHDDICLHIPDEYCPKKREWRKVSKKENTHTGKDETSLSEATNEDKTDFSGTISSPPAGLTAEESRCPHCDFINLADASLCISCAEPLTETSHGTSRAEPPRKASLSHTEQLVETSRSHAEPHREISRPNAKPLIDTSLSHAKQLTDTVLSRAKQVTHTNSYISGAESLTDTSLSHAKPLMDSSLKGTNSLTDTRPKRAETLPDTSQSDAKQLTDTSVSQTEPLTNTSHSRAEPQTVISGLKVSQDTEPEGQTVDEIPCQHCTFNNPKTNKICCMCSKTMNLSPVQLQDEHPCSGRHEKLQFVQIVKLPDTSATSLMEHKSSHQNGESEKAKFVQVINIPDDSSASQIGNKLPNGDADSTRNLEKEEEENPGCPHCTYHNPLPTNFCKMCGQRLTKAVNSTESPKRLMDLTRYQSKHGVQATSHTTGGQDAHVQIDQSLVKNKDEYLKTEVSSSEQLLLDERSKEFIRCITCKGVLKEDHVFKERRKCTSCPCCYCRECRQPFTEWCYRFVCPFTSHCHHKRSCTYWLRQKTKVDLEWYLQQSKQHFLSYMEWVEFCSAEGIQAQWSEYKNYLIKTIQEQRIDPADMMTRHELSTLIKIMLDDIDIEWNANRETLLEFVKKNIPF